MPLPVNVKVALALPEFAPLLGVLAVPCTVLPPMTVLFGPFAIESVTAPLAVKPAWTSSMKFGPPPRSMSKIVVSPSTGTRALGSVSVYGRSRRPAPAASTIPIMVAPLKQG